MQLLERGCELSSNKTFVDLFPKVQALKSSTSDRWLVKCPHCTKWHKHGPKEGIRHAHCNGVIHMNKMYFVKAPA